MANEEIIGSAAYERKIFWSMYKSYLEEIGNPFYITSERQFAVVNKPTPNWSQPCITIDFLAKKKILRVGVFILNDIPLYNSLLHLKETVNERFFPLKPIWCSTDASETARRIKIEMSFRNTNKEEYRNIIKESAKYTQLLIECFKPYIEC